MANLPPLESIALYTIPCPPLTDDIGCFVPISIYPDRLLFRGFVWGRHCLASFPTYDFRMREAYIRRRLAKLPSAFLFAMGADLFSTLQSSSAKTVAANQSEREAYENADFAIVATPTNYDSGLGDFEYGAPYLPASIPLECSDGSRAKKEKTVLVPIFRKNRAGWQACANTLYNETS